MFFLRAAGWAFVSACIIFLAFQPIGLTAQALFGGIALCGLLFIHLMKLKGVMRHVFLAIACSVALRYLYWRATSTLPDTDDLLSFIPGVLLFIAELYSISMLFISVLVSSDPIKRKKVTLSGPPSHYPTVDIFVPSYNEDDDILCTTLAAAKNIDYPTERLNIYLLDDGGTDQKCNSDDAAASADAIARRARLQAFCLELGIHYLTREKNTLAKAGNLNNGLEFSSGEFVVVFDADHAPVRSFLKKTMGYLQKNDNLFLVQTPHFFLNADPVEKNLETFEIMPSENEMFYSVTQKGLDKWDASFFCGSGAILRRKALYEVGGFKGVSITEDCETALALHSRGWSSAYVDEPLLAGFQPETVSAFLTQRSRWCQGMSQILILKRPFLMRGLNPMQRIAYLSSMLFWLFPFSRLMFVFSPALFVFFDLEIYNASLQEFFVYTAMFIACGAITQNYLYGKVRWPWISETYEYFQSFTLLRVIFSTILNPRKPTFKVTDKGTSLENDFFSEHGWMFLISHLFLLATLFYGLYRLHMSDYSNGLLLVVSFWAFFNVVLAGLALGVCAERSERRRHYRLPLAKKGIKGELKLDGTSENVVLEDVAIGGFSVAIKGRGTQSLYKKGNIVSLELAKPDGDTLLHRFNVRVQWARSENGIQRIGLRLVGATARDRRVLTFLMLAHNDALTHFRDKRKVHRPLLQGTGTIIVWSVVHAIRAWKSAWATYGQRKARHENVGKSTKALEA